MRKIRSVKRIKALQKAAFCIKISRRQQIMLSYPHSPDVFFICGAVKQKREDASADKNRIVLSFYTWASEMPSAFIDA
jgi:hypothetical protein